MKPRHLFLPSLLLLVPACGSETAEPAEAAAARAPAEIAARPDTAWAPASVPAAGEASAEAANARPWVTGYYAGWFWDQSYPPQRVDMSAMTHFVFGRVAPGGGSLGGTPGILVQGAGTAHRPGLAPDGRRSVEDWLVARARASGTRALLMLGGDGADGLGFLRSTPDNIRPAFVKRIVDYLVAHNYDGVDIDWENELHGNQQLGVSAAEAQRRLKQLIREVRAEANRRPRYRTRPVIITFPGYAANVNFLQPGGKVEQWQADVARLVDQYNLMSYGVGTAYNGGGWSSWFSGPIMGASGTTPIDLASSVRAYVATGVPRRKIGIGIGFYGIYYGPAIKGPRRPTEGNSIFEYNDVALAYSELVRKGYLSRGRYHWDSTARAGYRSYAGAGYVPANDPGAAPAGFLSYEDENSILAKGRWVRGSGLGGTIVWTINYGYLPATRTNPLLSAVKQSFLEPQP